MRRGRVTSQVTQLPMPGMPVPTHAPMTANCWSVTLGQEVLYMGRINGGPRYGSRGTVKRTRRWQAVVDLGRSGTWNVPYFLLATAQAA